MAGRTYESQMGHFPSPGVGRTRNVSGGITTVAFEIAENCNLHFSQSRPMAKTSEFMRNDRGGEHNGLVCGSWKFLLGKKELTNTRLLSAHDQILREKE